VVFQKGTGIGYLETKKHINFILKNDLSRWVGDDLRKLVKENKIADMVNFINTVQ